MRVNWSSNKIRVTAAVGGILILAVAVGLATAGIVPDLSGTPLGALRRQMSARVGALGAQSQGVEYGMHSMLPATLSSSQIATVLDQGKASGATWVRVTFNWSSVQP